MKTIRSITAGNTHRLPARLKLITTRLGSLLLLFQRMPVVQFLFPEANIIGGASVANTISLAVTTVVGLGAYDSVAGQTTINQVLPLANSTTVPATVSASLNFEFTCTTAPSRPKSWSSTTLPAVLSLTYTNTTPTGAYNNFITGTPSFPGSYPVTVTVWQSSNYGGDSVDQLFTIYVLGFSTQPAATSTISSGGSTTLNCGVTGKPADSTLTYQWYQGTTGTTTTPVGTNSASYTTPSLTASTNYWVRLKSVLGANTVYANSNTAAVNVNPPPSVVTVSLTPSGVTEDGAGNLAYTFTRTGATASALTTNFNVTGSGAFAIDYTQTGAAGFTASSGSVTIPIGATTATVTIDPTGDSTVEPDETVTLTVATGSGYTVGVPAAATGAITNDDTPYSSWASGLSVGQNGATQTPQGDGVTNLEKFAFNLNPAAPDVRHLTLGAGALTESAGLPAGAKVGGALRIEFLRRKASTNPGIIYKPQFSTSLGSWVDFSGTESVSPAADSSWERVTVDDTTAGPAHFGRVKVVQAP